MPGNESSSSDREKSPCLMRSNNDQRRRSKEVSPKVGEPLRKYPKRKRPKSCSKSSNDRRTDEQRRPSPKRRSKKSKKRHRSRSKKSKKKKHQRYSSSPSPSSSSNNDSDGSNYRNNEGKESTDSRFKVVSEEDQYKYSLLSDITQYANVNFDTYIKEEDLIKAVLIKNPVPESINIVKTLDDFVKDTLKKKKKQKDHVSTMFLKKFKVEIDQLWVHYQKFGLQLSQPDYPKGFSGG